LWSASASGTVTGTPRIVDGTLFVGASDVLDAYRAAGCGAPGCAPAWTATANGPLTTAPTSTTKLVFIASQKGTLYAFPATGCGHSTCSPTWAASVGGRLTAPTVSGATVYVGSSNGNVYGFNLAGCSKPLCSPTIVARVMAPVANAPVVDDGHLFVTDTAHALHVFRLP
jgi:outer membrane protein assembly factor BamB